ncbi:hypothetical protein QE152_g18996 [Popillia japonica]|uniref:Uncharacterized protein n=2 Tax=Popillia japonica TaxID=7064 RepID=A0AAW1L4Y3_POPJA
MPLSAVREQASKALSVKEFGSYKAKVNPDILTQKKVGSKEENGRGLDHFCKECFSKNFKEKVGSSKARYFNEKRSYLKENGWKNGLEVGYFYKEGFSKNFKDYLGYQPAFLARKGVR